MKTALICCAIVLLTTIPVRADTAGEIEGTMKNGHGLVIFGCGVDDPNHLNHGCFIAEYSKRKSAQRIEFAHEPCVISGLDIHCAANGKSPLAGTSYVGKSMKWACGKPKTVYRLVKAPRKSLAPLLLIENQDCEP